MNASSLASPQRGTSLIEALVAFLVLSFGMLLAASLQAHLRINAELTRQRAEAVRVGQQEIETLRAFSTIGTSPGVPSYAEIASTHSEVGGDASGTRFSVTREIDGTSLAHRKTASITVSWIDRAGAAQSVVLHTIIAEADPAYSGALALVPGTSPAAGAFGRSVKIPIDAKDLGDGRSVLKPVEGGSVALIFDNASGLVSGQCTAVSAALGTHALSAGDLSGCVTRIGYLLSGIVRFSDDAAPNPAAANAAPLPMSIALAISGTGYPMPPQCDSEAMKTVTYAGATGLQTGAVPLSAAPDSIGLATWTDTGDRYVAYHCVVYQRANGQWTGRSTIVPNGWTIGTGTTDRRICRYSADLDGSGVIDNFEHPSTYTGVDQSLANQNFLVVTGSSACPDASAAGGGFDAGAAFANLSTVPHQP